MFSLLRGAYGEITRKDEFFVALLGLDGAGKTTYLERLKAHLDRHYCGRNLAKIGPTVGLNRKRPEKDFQ
uniref:GTP-binding protein sar1 n=1 Tax=Globodera pallida TaxID=36090 RepID=A0A183CAW1_GLOPA